HDHVDMRGHETFLKDDVEPGRQRLQQAERTHAVGTIPDLKLAQQTALQQRHVRAGRQQNEQEQRALHRDDGDLDHSGPPPSLRPSAPPATGARAVTRTRVNGSVRSTSALAGAASKPRGRKTWPGRTAGESFARTATDPRRDRTTVESPSPIPHRAACSGCNSVQGQHARSAIHMLREVYAPISLKESPD